MRIVNLIQKKPVTANCDQGSGVCTVTIQNFPIPIAAPCQAGDCVSPTNAILQAGARLRRAAARLLLAQCSCPQACSPRMRECGQLESCVHCGRRCLVSGRG
jgi:hypothetical protein